MNLQKSSKTCEISLKDYYYFLKDHNIKATKLNSSIESNNKLHVTIRNLFQAMIIINRHECHAMNFVFKGYENEKTLLFNFALTPNRELKINKFYEKDLNLNS